MLIANRHYLSGTDDYFEAATGRDARGDNRCYGTWIGIGAHARMIARRGILLRQAGSLAAGPGRQCLQLKSTAVVDEPHAAVGHAEPATLCRS